MLNDVIVSQGVLGGLHLLANAAIFAFLLLGLGVTGVIASRKLEARSRMRAVLSVLSRATVILGLLVVAGIALMIGVSAWEARPKPRHWDVDLTGRTSLGLFQFKKCAEWKIGPTVHRDCIVEGTISLRARFPKGRTVQESGHALWVSGAGDDLTSLHLFLRPITRTELEAKLVPLFAAWDVPSTALPEWRSEGTRSRRYFTTREDQRDLPWLEVSVSSPDTGKDSPRPWVASFKWHWTPRDPTS